MNNIYEKTTKDRFIAFNDKTINELIALQDLKCWHLYSEIARRQSFKNGLVGVFEELSFYYFSKLLSSQFKIDMNTQKIKRLFKKLEDCGLVKIINEKSLIILLTTAEQAEQLNTLDEVLDYVQCHEQEFNFHIQHKRANEFFSQFNRPRLQTAQGDNCIGKALALDTLIKSRPGRSTPSAKELKEAEEWATVIDQDEEDPFEQHIKRNNIFILRNKEYEKQDEF